MGRAAQDAHRAAQTNGAPRTGQASAEELAAFRAFQDSKTSATSGARQSAASQSRSARPAATGPRAPRFGFRAENDLDAASTPSTSDVVPTQELKLRERIEALKRRTRN